MKKSSNQSTTELWSLQSSRPSSSGTMNRTQEVLRRRESCSLTCGVIRQGTATTGTPWRKTWSCTGYATRWWLLPCPQPQPPRYWAIMRASSPIPRTCTPEEVIRIKKVLSGEFVVINCHLVNDLIKLNLWNPSIKNKLIQFNGSVQSIAEIPKEIRELYKTVWEIS